jgi:acetyltransferase
LLVPQALVSPAGVAQAIVNASQGTKKTVLSCVMGDESVPEARLVLQGNNIPMYVYPETPGVVLSAMLRYKEWLQNIPAAPQPLAHVDNAAAQKILAAASGGSLGEAQTRPLLEAYGIPVVPGAYAASAEEAVTTARKLGYPLVMKIVSPDILHKSDAGGIRLNLASDEQVTAEYDRLMADIRAAPRKPNSKVSFSRRWLPRTGSDHRHEA